IFLSEFILFRQFYLSTEIQIQFILSFCLSVCFFSLNMTATYIFIKTGNKEYNVNPTLPFLITTIASIFWISTILLISYFFKYSFLIFIIITTSISLIHIISFSIWNLHE